jgi:hypothetical protein
MPITRLLDSSRCEPLPYKMGSTSVISSRVIMEALKLRDIIPDNNRYSSRSICRLLWLARTLPFFLLGKGITIRNPMAHPLQGTSRPNLWAT